VDFIEELALRLRATEDVYNVIADAPSPLIDINKVRCNPAKLHGQRTRPVGTRRVVRLKPPSD
jgi:hypothetical protein